MIDKIDDNVVDIEEELLATKSDIKKLNERLKRNFDVVVGLIREVQKQIQDNYIVPKNNLPHVDVGTKEPTPKQDKIKVEGLDNITKNYKNKYQEDRYSDKKGVL
ncbi:MAG: hypothetical protein GX963_05020 [Bacteroidales bacterium]|mgnify:CR=1 FL=1|nr:hypothetical protein [Bacteroidales bacterium]